jgi:hypothetical protein
MKNEKKKGNKTNAPTTVERKNRNKKILLNSSYSNDLQY